LERLERDEEPAFGVYRVVCDVLTHDVNEQIALGFVEEHEAEDLSLAGVLIRRKAYDKAILTGVAEKMDVRGVHGLPIELRVTRLRFYLLGRRAPIYLLGSALSWSSFDWCLGHY
jgi:hypothetical protein